MNEATCVNCGQCPMNNPDEVNCCMLCGGTLCEHCYDESPYCNRNHDEQPPYSGVCVECERNSTRLNAAGVCEGCVMQAMIDQQQSL